MKMSKLFSQTLREAPTEADVISHQLLLRAGFIRQLGAGIFSYLPLAKRTITKIENIMRDEINAIGGQELTMPVINPADIWKETQRWYQIGTEMGRFKDKSGRDMVLAMTHEEVVTDLIRKEIRSYRQLPALIYHLQTKWRDDPRPRAGLVRVREFTMLDSYSLDATWESLDAQYEAHYQAYFNIYNRCALPTVAVKADVGMMGGKMSHEFMYDTSIGEDTLVICDNCGYLANRQVARFSKPSAAPEELQIVQKVATPNIKTIEALATFLNVPAAKTAKAVFMVATITEKDIDRERFVFAIVRGDMDVNETKLANAVQAKELRPAREEEIRTIGAVPGYASPLGLTTGSDLLIIVDDAVTTSPNLVAGANETDYHLLNTNFGRDYEATIVTDIASAGEGASCPVCQHSLRTFRGVEVGNIFKLGTRYSQAMGANFLDADGQSNPVIMGSYGIGVGRLLACIVEEHHDDFGIRWPITVAPYQLQLVALAGKQTTENAVEAAADLLYQQLQKAGVEVLYDDRDEAPGVKFKDADLIGLPLRLTVSERSLKNGGVELKRRTANSKEFEVVSVEEAVSRVQAAISTLQAEIAAKVVAVPFRD
jgi:prolyl-tRNA synthetase